jgi:hypothetical protein
MVLHILVKVQKAKLDAVHKRAYWILLVTNHNIFDEVRQVWLELIAHRSDAVLYNPAY